MKKVPCSYSGCGDRRVHYEHPDTPRKRQMVEVPDDFNENNKVYCSIECAAYDGSLKKIKIK